MTQVRFSTAARVDQVVAALTPDGMTTAAISQVIGVSTDSRMSLIVTAALESGRVFRARARVTETIRSPEWVYFPTQQLRDEFAAAYASMMKAKRAERDRIKSRRKRDRSREIAARSVKRAEARSAREAEAIQAIQLRMAEAELAKQRRRLEREAAAAEKQRLKAEAKSLQKRLKAETKAAGAKVFKPGTSGVAPAKQGPARIAGDLDLSRAKITIAPPMPERWAVGAVPSVVDSRQARSWAEAVAA